jgi:hypothetical protein
MLHSVGQSGGSKRSAFFHAHMYRFVLVALLLVEASARPRESVQLRIEAPPELAQVRARLESMDRERFASIAQLVGVTDPGPAIRVLLATEKSEVARGVPPWISGFAVGESDLVVIFPARSSSYPNNTLEDVMRHEIAHVLIWRGSGGQPIPRWFNEGLAMAAERERRFADQTQLLYQLVTGSETHLDELNRLFLGGQSDQTRAYALAGAFVHDVLQQFGPATGGQILTLVSRGARFDSAFADVTGVAPSHAESEFWRRQRIWTTWVPIITSSTTLWLVVTLLAILAIYIRRRRNRELQEQWAKEDSDDDQTINSPDDTV